MTGPATLAPPGLVLQTLPDPLSLEAIAIYVAGLLGLTGVRYAFKRWRKARASTDVGVADLLEGEPVAKSGPGTTVRTAEPADGTDQVVKRTATGTHKSNVAFTLPEFLPVSRGIREVTHDEIHALELGFIVGLAAAWLYSVDQIELTVSILAVFIAGALGYKRYRSKAFKTVRYEPWYGLLAFGAGAGLGYLLFVAQVVFVAEALP